MKIVALAAIALGLSAGTAAAEPLAMNKQRLGWERSPQVVHMTKYFPTAAKSAGVKDATVDLACTPDKWGALECEVSSETPAGLGFGEAAVKVVEKGRVFAADRASPEGKTFRYAVKFGRGFEEARRMAARSGR